MWMDTKLCYIPHVSSTPQCSTDVSPISIIVFFSETLSSTSISQFKSKLVRDSRGFPRLLIGSLHKIFNFFLKDAEKKLMNCLKCIRLQSQIQGLFDKSTSRLNMLSSMNISGKMVVITLLLRSRTYLEINCLKLIYKDL